MLGSKQMQSMRTARSARRLNVRCAAAPTTTVQAPGAPKTGQHQVATELRDEALAYFFKDPKAVVCRPTTGGVNNVCTYVDTPDGEKYVLRIYNNGNRSDKVIYEHELLRQLAQQKDTLSFKLPEALPSIKDGKTHVLLSSGAESCVFHLIPGSLAKTTSPQEVGRATGELCRAMSKIDMGDLVSPIAPYYDLYRAHLSMTREKFFNEIDTNPEFNKCREAIDYLADQIRQLEPKLIQLEKSGLPKQVIHADLHYDNVMVLGDSVSGLLDFEFALYDWRLMELAVALSKYVGESDPLKLCCEFVSGYAQNGELTQQEIEVIPDAINLRIFSNCVFFVGRALEGEDSIDSLTSRAGMYAKRVQWVNANRQNLIKAITDLMNSKGKTA